MITLSVSEVRARFKDTIERVKSGEEIDITQNGEVVATLLHPSKLRKRIRTPNTIAGEKLLRTLKEDKKNPPEFGGGIDPEQAEAYMRAIRAERDEDIWD